MSKNAYTAVYEMDHTGWWFVSVPELPGCHSQGRTLESARGRALEAVALWLDTEEDAFDLVDDIRIPEDARRATHNALQARAHAKEAERNAIVSTLTAAEALVKHARLGVRDAAKLLGISHQRVAQLLASSKDASSSPRKPG